MKAIGALLFLLLTSLCDTSAQQLMKLSLNEAIEIAIEHSPEARIVKNQYQIEEWKYKLYKARLKPSLILDGTLPNFNRSLTSVLQDDGTTLFISQSQADYSLSLDIQQEIPITGGSVFVTSGLERIDIFGDNESTSYLSSPISIGIRQPIFSFNEFKWLKKTEPLRLSASMKAYRESMEDVAMQAINAYFDAYLSIINLQMAIKNKANNDTLYRITEGRYNLGKVAENDLLQMELSLLKTEAAVEESELNVRINELKLKRFLDLDENITIQLGQLDEVPDLQIETNDAIEKAKANNSLYDNIEQASIRAQQELSRAKTGSRFRADLFASYGLNSTAPAFSDSYKDPQDRQQVNLGIQLPILDWGKASTDIKIAQANADVIMTEIERDRTEFEQRIILEIAQFNLQNNQVRIATKADQVAAKRYEVTKNRYYIGKIGITDLNIALNEKDAAKRELIRAMRNYWINYYNVRKLTLYDYMNREPVY